MEKTEWFMYFMICIVGSKGLFVVIHYVCLAYSTANWAQFFMLGKYSAIKLYISMPSTLFLKFLF